MKTVPVPSLPCDDAYDPTEDRAITREELEDLRHWLRSDGPAHDESPAWYDREAIGPGLSDDQGGFFGWGEAKGWVG